MIRNFESNVLAAFLGMKRMDKLKELVEEAKRRTILWAIFVSGLAYLLSLTSSSIWLNVPIATFLLIFIRYLSFELEIRKRVQELNIPSHLSHLLKHQLSIDDPLFCSPPVSISWRRKIDSPVIEAAVDDFTRRIVQEFVTDSWYSALSPDKDVPEQIRLLINDIFGELGQRVKRINLINLLTRDIVDLVGNHLELFRQTKASVKVFESLSSEERDERLKLALLRKNELHPALSSKDSECKVLQQLMSGMVAIVLRPQDAQCPLMRCLARELLACAVLRPVMNFASPGFINKSIEKATLSAREKSQIRNAASASSNTSNEASYRGSSTNEPRNSSKNSWGANRLINAGSGPDGLVQGKQEDWGQVLDVVSERRTRTLAPENLDNLWTKGQNYKKRELERASAKRNPGVPVVASARTSEISSRPSIEKQDMRPTVKDLSIKHGVQKANQVVQTGDSVRSTISESSIASKDARRPLELSKTDKRHDSVSGNQSYGYGSLQQGEGVSGGVQSTGEVNTSTRRSSPTSLLHAPQEYMERPVNEPLGAGSQHRRTRSSSAGSEIWQKLEHSTTNQDSNLDYWDTPGMQISMGNSELDQVAGWLTEPVGTTGQGLLVHSAASKLNCWVVGAHLEKAASKTFAVYSIAVTDSDNNTWFVERRFRNFEQLHRKLRDLPQYNLQLPPKRFLSSSLDDSFVRDRCILLDKYLKDLLSIPSIAELHEVWDFLSVTSKSYAYSKSPSVMKTLAVNVDDAVDDMFRQLKGVSDGLLRRVGGPSSPTSDEASQLVTGDGRNLAGASELLFGNNVIQSERVKSEQYSDDEYTGPAGTVEEESAYLMERWPFDNDLQDTTSSGFVPQRIPDYDKNVQWLEKRIERGGSDAFSLEESTTGSEVFEEDLIVPPEWTPPKLTVPLLNLVDSIFQLQDRDWIRRQVFWIAKQILQLGMGDAVDDWLVTQIQHLRQEDVVAGVIRSVQEILWPGGVFITKAKKTDAAAVSPVGIQNKVVKQASQKGMDQSAFFESQLEAARCARVVHEVLVEGAPTPLVSFVGKQQYTRCANEIYYFLQSSVFLKQLMYSILETLLTATFPEMTHIILDIRQGSGQVMI